MVQTDDTGFRHRTLACGSGKLFGDIDGEQTYLLSIEKVHLEGFLKVAASDKVISVAFHQLRLCVGHLNRAPSGHLKVLYAVHLFESQIALIEARPSIRYVSE